MSSLKKYLPSKKFISAILIIIIFVGLYFSIKGIILLFKKDTANQTPKLLVVSDIIQKDSNSNGIPDWEEYLWGLDPNTDGPGNKEIILSKKESLIKSGDIVPYDNSKAITDNEMLSQEFFATIVSLQQTGQLDSTAIQSVSEAVGKNIEVTPIPDIYTSTMLIIKKDSATANTTYHEAVSNLISKYKDANIGSELTFIVQGLSNKDPQALYAAMTVGQAYRSFGKELMKIPVPASLAIPHLSMANNYEKTGQTINSLTKVLTDPLSGMKAVLNYKKYSDALASDLEKLSTILQ